MRPNPDLRRPCPFLRGGGFKGAGSSLNQKGKIMKVSLRLSDADRAKYGGDEWVHLETDDIADVGYDRLTELEREIRRHDDTSIARILGVEWPDTTMLGMRGVAWLARQFAGVREPLWPDFKPDVLGIVQKLNRSDVSPPAGGSSEPPSDETATAKTARSKKV